ncbi:bifunctional isocitrate dehydrogenase kinase/phosphatase [Aliiglaciecola sp. SL4]|uniref:bifunctional isocitrate dehydrogenase kinase/phosphatase n=1 Tax=Aliiglaciecola sp. SL4 TaxID=3239806 RepID=UPI00355B6B25
MPSIQEKVAYQILYGFEKNYRWFCRITSGAKQRFEQAQWQATQLAVKERISIYEQSLADTISEVYALINPRQQSHAFWHQVKHLFALQLEQHPQYELAETFYNSVIGRLYKHNKIDDQIMFVLPSRCYIPGQDKQKVVNSFDTSGTVGSMMEAILAIYRFSIPYENKQSDIEQLDRALRARLNKAQLASVHTVEILKPVFFRGKAAYLVGRICMPEETLPFVIALLINDEKQLQVDALLTSNKDLTVIFGFARAYFMADTLYPAEIVAFLQELMPNKKNFELYMSIGHYKHGKTVFYRNFLQHLDNTDDKFTIAPGIRGLVMAVFHLPSYGVVFKIIKDEFPESKRVTREQVRECYRLVKTTDRVGRMADTHEYVNFRLPKDRVEPELLEELLDVASKNIEVNENEIIIKHVYIERKMTPLNIFLQTETDENKIHNAINDLGFCIKQIAAANIFPGDMLHKNFGVTRNGRVIFYDYDEICLMHQRTFRELPKSDDPFAMDTLSVSPEDVFPEQFEHFIVGKRHLKDLLKKLHPDLMTAKYWVEAQKKAATGTVQHFTPYSPELRFKRV